MVFFFVILHQRIGSNFSKSQSFALAHNNCPQTLLYLNTYPNIAHNIRRKWDILLH